MKRDMRARIRDIRPGSEHRDRGAVRIQRGAMRNGVDPQRHPADDGRPCSRQSARDLRRHSPAVIRCTPCPDDSDDDAIQQIEIAVPPKPLGRTGQIEQPRRIVFVADFDDPQRQARGVRGA